MTESSRTFPLGEMAQAVFGPLHRHVAQIQEGFRDPSAPRGAPAYRLTFDAQGDKIIARAGPGVTDADFVRAQRIIDALIDQARRKGRVREGEVLAAIAFSEGEQIQHADAAAAARRPHAAHAAPSALRRGAAR
ncbi:MAG: hypothetical protein IPG56_11065 [Caulobacteraceae bacterium]|nr:hypothetical protein [Caulobacteraceae bacterium]